MNNSVLVTVKGLKKYFPLKKGFLRRTHGFVRAVDHVDLEIRKGEILGLVGESGCGKTTLGRCILRLVEPSGGKIYFDNQDILSCGHHRMRHLRQDMQIIFQDPYSSLNPRKTAGQIIGEPFAIHRMYSRQKRQERIKFLMDVVGLLPEHAHRYPHEFSGGQRQRIGVARALALNPKFVIADEPVSALDVSIQAQILNMLVQLQDLFKLTFLFISHSLSVVRHMSDRVAVMYLGKIVELANSSVLYDQQLHPYTEALIASAPIPDPSKRKGRVELVLEGDVPSPIDIPTGCSFHPRCRYRDGLCIQQIPELKERLEGHWVACHFPRNNTPLTRVTE